MTIPKHYEITDERWARIEELFPPYRTSRPAKLGGVNVIADKAYGTAELRQYIEAEHGQYTILSKSNTANLCLATIMFTVNEI